MWTQFQPERKRWELQMLEKLFFIIIFQKVIFKAISLDQLFESDNFPTFDLKRN